MGWLNDVGKIIIGAAIGGAGGALSVFSIEHGAEVIEGTIDTAQQIVKIGEDVYRAIPPEAFALGGLPLHGLLKHEVEDELILLGHIAGDAAISTGLYWPALGPVGASLAIAQGSIPLYVATGSLIGKLHHRQLNDQEWEMAQYIFRDTLYDRDQILLTNLGGLDGRAFVYPIGPLGPILVNLGSHYIHNDTIRNGPLLFHELTHVWQAKQSILREVFLYDATEREYDFTYGHQWSGYNLEQQAGIVEAWAIGAIERTNGILNPVRNKYAVGSPLFRYINGNVRRSDTGAKTSSGQSVRQLLKEGGHRSFRDMRSTPPSIWWP